MANDYNLLDYMDSFDFSDNKKDSGKENMPKEKHNKNNGNNTPKNRDNYAKRSNNDRNDHGNQNRQNQQNQKTFNKQGEFQKNNRSENPSKEIKAQDKTPKYIPDIKPENKRDVGSIQKDPEEKANAEKIEPLKKAEPVAENNTNIAADTNISNEDASIEPVSSVITENITDDIEMPFKEEVDNTDVRPDTTEEDIEEKTKTQATENTSKKEVPVHKDEQAKESADVAEQDNTFPAEPENEMLAPLPDGFLDNNKIGEKISENEAARIINCSVRELVRITELYNEYLTCTKTEDGHFLYNRYDIATILQILYDQVDGGYSDKDMLAYMKDDDSYKRPFKDNAKEFPEQIRLAVNQAFKGYAYELQTSVKSLIGQISETISSMNATIASQKIMLEEQSRTMKDQTDVIMKMAGQLEKDAKAFDNIPQIMSSIPKAVTENSEKQSKAINDILQQMRSGQGETKKAISDLLSEIEKVREAGQNDESTKKIESLSENLNKVTKEQSDKLSEIVSAIDSNEKLKAENNSLQEKLDSTQKALEQSKTIEEYNTLSDSYNEASEQIDELQQQVESISSALEISEAKDQTHMKELSDFRNKVSVALKNMAEESDKKSERIKELESKLRELGARQSATRQNEGTAHTQEAPQGQQIQRAAKENYNKRQPAGPENRKSTTGMTSEQRKRIQKQYANEARRQTVKEQQEEQPSIPSWAISSQTDEEEIEAQMPKKKEKHGLFGGSKKSKEPIIEDVELDDDADLTVNTQKKKKFGLFR